MSAVVLAVVAVVLSLSMSGPRDAARSHRASSSATALLARSRAGLGRSFTATYVLSGQLAPFPGPRWTVVVAHRGAPPVGTNWRTDGGQWSFSLHARHGIALQWIEKGRRHVACWQRAGEGITCSAGVTEPSNGTTEATVPYLPGMLVAELAAVTRMRGIRAVTSTRASRFGELGCATARGTTLCFTSQGLPGWVHSSRALPIAPFGKATITLRSLTSKAKTAAFVPDGRPKGKALPPL